MTKQTYTEKLQATLDAAFSKEQSSVLGFFITHFRFTYLIILGVLFVGFFALFTLPREANPEIKIPVAVVTSVYPGASPTDVEDLITTPLEERIKNVENVKLFTSSSASGIAAITVEFEASAPLEESFQKLRDAVAMVESELPSDATDPVVTEIRFEDMPIVTYSLVADLPERELKILADDIKLAFEGIANVSKVTIQGGKEREYKIVVDQTKLANYNLTLSAVVGAIARNNVNAPVGAVSVDGFEYNVRVVSKDTDVRQLGEIVVITSQGQPVYVRDVARVIDGFADAQTESRLGLPNGQILNTVSLQIFKKTGGNILDIVDQSAAVLEQSQRNGVLPESVSVLKTNDNSVFIRDDLSRLGKSGLQTMVLIVIILFAVLGFRSAVITGLSVPIAFLMAFIVLMIQGLTLNSLVLFSLVLSLGLMVDNSIVIMEGLNEYMKNHGKSAYEAAILSVWNYKWPIVAGTLTTVSAFVPMLLVSGILGQFLRILPITISATLLSSLFVALVILPTLAARLVKVHGRMEYERTHHKAHWFTRSMHAVKDWYAKKLRILLTSKRFRRRLIGLAWLVFIMSVIFPAAGFMKIELFPNTDVDYFAVDIELPAGTSLDATSMAVQQVEAIVLTVPELDNFVTTIGAASALDGSNGSSNGSTHMANIIVNLVDGDLRERKSFEIVDSLRPQFDSITSARVTLTQLSGGPPTGAPIEVRVSGSDVASLLPTVGHIQDILDAIPMVINVRDNMQDTSGEFTFVLDRARASYYGLDSLSVAQALRGAVYGIEATEISVDGEDVAVMVQYDADTITSLRDLEDVLLRTVQGEYIPVAQIATVSLEPSLLSIKHRDGNTSISISAELETGGSLQNVLTQFNEALDNIAIPDDVEVQVGGEVEDIDQSFRELFLSMIVAVVLIAFILVLQFNSFRQPFIILFALPLALPGVILGLNLIRLPLSFAVFIGIVSLSGIVVNDSIVLIDKINKNIHNGMETIDGIIDAGLSRMQPIFLTSLTTIAGIVPLIFADEFWRGLSFTIIFGLVFSTILTLIIVPAMYIGITDHSRFES